MNPRGEPTVSEHLWAKIIGQEVLKFAKDESIDRGQQVDGAAVKLLERIKAILDDDALDDPECFGQIEAVVDAFHEAGIPTSRHDW